MDATDHLRRFRHFLRHAYAAELDRERLGRLAKTWLDLATSSPRGWFTSPAMCYETPDAVR